MIKTITIQIAAFLLIISPSFALANGVPDNAKLIICNTKPVTVIENGERKMVFADPCTYKDLIKLGNNVINFLIYLAIPVAALAFSWAGFLILSAGGNVGQREKGKEVFIKVAKGLFFMLAAWLIVKFILDALLDDGYSILG